MSLTIEEVEHIAKLARLELSAEQKELLPPAAVQHPRLHRQTAAAGHDLRAADRGRGTDPDGAAPRSDRTGALHRGAAQERSRGGGRSVQDPACIRVRRPTAAAGRARASLLRTGPRRHPRMTALTDLSLTEMQRGLQEGSFSSRELVQAALDACRDARAQAACIPAHCVRGGAAARGRDGRSPQEGQPSPAAGHPGGRSRTC